MIIVWVIVIGLIVLGGIALTRHSDSTSNTGSKRDPIGIAKERYARGEITKEEFERIKKDLM